MLDLVAAGVLAVVKIVGAVAEALAFLCEAVWLWRRRRPSVKGAETHAPPEP